jgi:hypothetical protein
LPPARISASIIGAHFNTPLGEFYLNVGNSPIDQQGLVALFYPHTCFPTEIKK